MTQLTSSSSNNQLGETSDVIAKAVVLVPEGMTSSLQQNNMKEELILQLKD
jgi:hypothetical protein